jgi:hypothetical protein
MTIYTYTPTRDSSVGEQESTWMQSFTTSAIDEPLRGIYPAYKYREYKADRLNLGPDEDPEYAGIYELFLPDRFDYTEQENPLLTLEQARGQLDSLNIKLPKEEMLQTRFPQGIRQKALDFIVEDQKQRMAAADVWNRKPEGFILPASAFVGGMVTSTLADPINLAIGLIPFVGQGAWATRLVAAGGARAGMFGRAGARFAVGALEAGLASAAVEPFYYEAAQRAFDDYTLADSLLNIAIGTVVGGGLHVVFRPIRTRGGFALSVKGERERLRLAEKVTSELEVTETQPRGRPPPADPMEGPPPRITSTEIRPGDVPETVPMREVQPEPGSAAYRVADFTPAEAEFVARDAMAQTVAGRELDIEPAIRLVEEIRASRASEDAAATARAVEEGVIKAVEPDNIKVLREQIAELESRALTERKLQELEEEAAKLQDARDKYFEETSEGVRLREDISEPAKKAMRPVAGRIGALPELEARLAEQQRLRAEIANLERQLKAGTAPPSARRLAPTERVKQAIEEYQKVKKEQARRAEEAAEITPEEEAEVRAEEEDVEAMQEESQAIMDDLKETEYIEEAKEASSNIDAVAKERETVMTDIVNCFVRNN